MDLSKLNPAVNSAGIYERIGKNGECIAYDSRLIYVFSGGLTVKVKDKDTYKLSPGHIIYIPAGVRYKLKSPAIKMGVITFFEESGEKKNGELIPPVASEEFVPDLLTKNECEQLCSVMYSDDMESERAAIERICNLYTNKEGEYAAFASAYLKIILLRLIECSADNALPSRMVEALDEYIRENISDSISNTELGAIFGYHPFYVSRMLKEKKGLTMKQYVIQYRLKLAKRLLELTKKSVNEIAEETGFTDASYFTKTFREAFAMTPKEYRNKFADEFI